MKTVKGDEGPPVSGKTTFGPRREDPSPFQGALGASGSEDGPGPSLGVFTTHSGVRLLSGPRRPAHRRRPWSRRLSHRTGGYLAA